MSVEDQGAAIREVESRMYRYAIRLTIVLSIFSGVMLFLNWQFHFLSYKALTVMGVGVFFWTLMAYAYWQDTQARIQNEKEAREAIANAAKENQDPKEPASE